MTYIMGTIITVAACFPCVQKADAILVYLGMAVEGAGVICICEHFLFPHIGFTRYWNEYRHQDFNTPAAIAWGVSIIFSFGLVFTYYRLQSNLGTHICANCSIVHCAGWSGWS